MSILPLSSEKSRSEAVVFPLLLEIQNLNVGKVTFFSGEMLDVDKSIGLIGEYDFIEWGANASRASGVIKI